MTAASDSEVIYFSVCAALTIVSDNFARMIGQFVSLTSRLSDFLRATCARARTMGNRYVGHPKFSLCLELEQFRDHFYYTNGGHLYNKSGLGFAVTQSITKLV